MPYPRVNDAWRRGVRWIDEEIYAWIDHEQALEDRLVDEGLAVSHTAGRLIRPVELQHVQARILESQQAEALNVMRSY